MAKENRILLRHNAIKELIETDPIEDQNDLVEMLKKLGIETTQSIISRDLRQLGISKKLVKGKMLYELPKIDTQREILHLAVKDVSHNEAIIIIKTMPGTADFVGDFLDTQNSIEILGTLAGENVVFVVPKSIKQIKQIYKAVCTVLHFK